MGFRGLNVLWIRDVVGLVLRHQRCWMETTFTIRGARPFGVELILVQCHRAVCLPFQPFIPRNIVAQPGDRFVTDCQWYFRAACGMFHTPAMLMAPTLPLPLLCPSAASPVQPNLIECSRSDGTVAETPHFMPKC